MHMIAIVQVVAAAAFVASASVVVYVCMCERVYCEVQMCGVCVKATTAREAPVILSGALHEILEILAVAVVCF